MARMVEIRIVYVMDDEDKPLGQELRDWIEGHISVQDFDFPRIVRDSQTLSTSEANDYITIQDWEDAEAEAETGQ